MIIENKEKELMLVKDKKEYMFSSTEDYKKIVELITDPSEHNISINAEIDGDLRIKFLKEFVYERNKLISEEEEKESDK